MAIQDKEIINIEKMNLQEIEKLTDQKRVNRKEIKESLKTRIVKRTKKG